ncbi:UNKNOWN [Stylonychia lemnae]|uniref:Nicotinamide n-methyltransferase n=1 Tax=Stylonychia lemnae TaxID=5949 RepID=A0A078AVI8_STYLE|nr:UNKNOWN [Stylonychia lemnae]|eukprot:CDW86204.1 UNKNOWN [Stylonychia lemnae]
MEEYQQITSSSSAWQRNKLTISQRFQEQLVFEDIIIKQTPHTEPPSCAIVLAKYVYKNQRQKLRGKKVIELGAGCGFTTIYLSQKLHPSKIVATDLGSVINIIKENIDLNRCEKQQVHCNELFWGNKENLQQVYECAEINNKEGEAFDLILGSDLIYDFEYFAELVQTLDSLYKFGRNEILFCFTHRFSDVERWFKEELEKKGFKIEYAKDDEFDLEFYESGKVFLIKIFKERQDQEDSSEDDDSNYS